ncbi:hypothetical protein CR513_01726, partial [Mucuna pruriens]
MIREGYQAGKGLGPHLDGISVLISVQENMGRSGLGYRGNNQGGSTSLAKGEAVLGQLFVRESIAVIGDETTCRMGEPSEPSEGVSTKVEALADIERRIDREKPKFEAPTEDLESINLRKGIEGREVRIGKQVAPDLRVKLVELLKEYAEIFTWSYQDMPGLDRGIIEHKLPLLPGPPRLCPNYKE